MFHSPFGPKVLEVDCPEEIISAINSYIDDGDHDPSIFPNLLNRDLSNVFLPKEFSDEIGLTHFIEMCAAEYLRSLKESSKQYNQVDVYYQFQNTEVEVGDVGNPILPDVEFNGRLYKDCWINRYYKEHLTPVHTHDGILSGVMFLKTLPRDESLNGVLEFIFGESSEFIFDRWRPKQTKGKILLFPSWLKHCVYPTQSSNERRTMSFNLTIE